MAGGGTRSRGLSGLLLGLLVLCAGLWAGASPAAADENPPTVADGSVTPSQLPAEGGFVTISATVSDDDGVASVDAELIGSNGSFQAISLKDQGAGRYTAKTRLPANFDTESEVGYQVYVNALDTASNSSTEFIGEASVAAAPQFDEAPIVSDASVAPRRLPAAGGEVTIEATATDNRSVSEAGATVNLPGGGSAAVVLEPISFTRFRGTFTAPANTSSQPVSYAVTVFAYDDIGQEDRESAGSFELDGSLREPACVPRETVAKASLGIEVNVWPTLHTKEVCPGSRIGSARGEWFVDRDAPVALIGTEMPPNTSEIGSLRQGRPWHLVTVPVGQTAIALVAHPPVGCAVTRVTNRQLEQVFRGRIGRWSELLTAPQVPACDAPLTRVVGAGPSAVNARFKRYLARMNKGPLPCIGGTWLERSAVDDGAANAPVTRWPEGCAAAKSALLASNEPAGYVNRNVGTIGVVRLDRTVGFTRLNLLELQDDGQLGAAETRTSANAAAFAPPNVGTAANCGGTTYKVPLGARPGQSGLDVDWSEVDGAQPAVGGGFYPLCTLAFFVGYNQARYLFPGEAKILGARDYLQYTVLSPHGQELLDDFYAMPLPSSPEPWRSVLLAARTAMGKISY
jgi:ABC-type phosphate transport system substrate-binding protein